MLDSVITMTWKKNKYARTHTDRQMNLTTVIFAGTQTPFLEPLSFSKTRCMIVISVFSFVRPSCRHRCCAFLTPCTHVSKPFWAFNALHPGKKDRISCYSHTSSIPVRFVGVCLSAVILRRAVCVCEVTATACKGSFPSVARTSLTSVHYQLLNADAACWLLRQTAAIVSCTQCLKTEQIYIIPSPSLEVGRRKYLKYATAIAIDRWNYLFHVQLFLVSAGCQWPLALVDNVYYSYPS